MENENAFVLVNEWNTKFHMENFIKSNFFGILFGAINLLSDSPKVRFNAVSATLDR